ncbi:MAG TPA: tRNA pseudouridine(13) synthase TruD, partial [Myxococcaceae bacterium]|nr:tRNA pseudouridine(13) synthase TruD [Myxococcaceae bacterium]
ERVRLRFGLRPGSISFCGLKDKQGRTEQLIAVDGAEVDIQEPDLRLKYLGRTDRPLTAANTTSNRFSVSVRALTEEDLTRLPVSAAEVNRLGVVNYFDSQRFGSLKHGQGFIAKDLIRGDFEAALHNFMAKPSPLDRSQDAQVKAFWRDHWGQWNKKPPMPGNAKYFRILQALRARPGDFVNAFLQIDANYRALLLFTYQSYLWNEGVRRFLATILPRQALFPMPYQAGTLLFHRDAPPEVLRELREMSFPLLAPDSHLDDPRVKAAVEWVLGKEKLTLGQLRIEEAPNLLFFRHEERPMLLYPHKLVLGRPARDELNRGFRKLNVSFTLPPGAYATLVIKRLFHFAWLEQDESEREEVAPPARFVASGARPGSARDGNRRTAAEQRPRVQDGRESRAGEERRKAIPPGRGAGGADAPSTDKPGFREAQRRKKEARRRAREASSQRRGPRPRQSNK